MAIYKKLPAFTLKEPRFLKRARDITCALVFSTLCGELAHSRELPKYIIWPQEISLEEEHFTYTPVSGSILLATMYSSDQIQTNSVEILIPDMPDSNFNTLCLRIDTRDGSYIGKASVVGQFSLPMRLKVSLKGKEFTNTLQHSAHAALLAWPGTYGQCAREPSQIIFPTSWVLDQSPLMVSFFVNSTGLSARIVLQPDPARAPIIQNCDKLPSTGASRVYDKICSIELCKLNATSQIWLEVRNFGRRAHLESIAMPSLSPFCE